MAERKLDFAIEIGATPDEVWRLLAEAEGIKRWFAPEAQVTPGAGGQITLSWGEGMEGTAPIHLWEPGRRIGWTESSGKVVEIEIEPVAAQGGEARTRLRLVQSGFGMDAKFDDEYESTGSGWQIFLAMLRHGAEAWRGKAGVRHVHQMRFLTVSKNDAWTGLLAASGLREDALADGAACRASIADRVVEGTVLRYLKPGYLVLAVPPDAMVALFVEGSRKALVTVQWIQAGAGDDALKAAMAEWMDRYTESVSR